MGRTTDLLKLCSYKIGLGSGTAVVGRSVVRNFRTLLQYPGDTAGIRATTSQCKNNKGCEEDS